jgi:sec-independent protein translocase protein TatA
MGMPSGIELLVIALVILLLFGGKKIPELAKGLGNGIKNFKKAVKDEDENIASTDDKIEKKEDSVVTTTEKKSDSQKA